MTTTLDDIIRKVQAMLARADHPNTPPAEAETARNMAEALMFKYRIEEAMLTHEQRAAAGVNVVWRTVPVCSTKSEFAQDYREIASMIIGHLDIRGVFKYDWTNEVVNVQWVGYESDLRFAEVLLTACVLAFGKRLEPTYDPTLTDQVNAYIMRKAGMEGRRIAMAIYGRDDKALRPKVRKMFADEATARGEDPRPLLGKGTNVHTYRKSYADGFTSELWSRLWTMRKARGEESQGLVLASRKDQIAEAFYEEFPQYRPKPVAAEIGDGYKEGDCEKCKKAKSGYCRDHAWRRPRKARAESFSSAGYNSGREAARTVDLGIKGRLEA